MLQNFKTEWDFSGLFDGADASIEKSRTSITAETSAFISKWKERSDWLAEPAALAEAITEYENWHKNSAMAGAEGYYFSLMTAKDENSAELKARSNKADEFAIKTGTDMQFFPLRLARVPEDVQRRFLAAPELAPWRHYLESLFTESKYLLSEAEEKILSLKRPTSEDNWERMVSGFISREERETLLDDGSRGARSFSDLMSLLQSQSKDVRDEAAKHVNDILDKYGDVAEHEMNSILQSKKTDDDLRGFTRPDASRHLSDDIDSEVVDALIASVASRFDLPARFYALKAKMMGVPKLQYHERTFPLGMVSKKFTFEEAYGLSHKVFSRLDPFFAETLDRFLAGGQIDVYPVKSKRGGAFCAHYTSKYPTYILLNFAENLHEVTTLAHEMGHGINNELVRAAQEHDLNFGTPTSTAEVASTFMEDFILEEILASADDETKLAIMFMKLNDDVSAIFRQAACYRFETELHAAFREKGYLSKAEIGGIFQKNMFAYIGEAVERSPGSENWWIYWSHIRNFFYVYSYASGQLISRSLQAGVKADPAFIEKVKGFLSAGLSDSPKNIFAKMGIDITDKDFWDRGLRETENLLLATEELAKKLGKI